MTQNNPVQNTPIYLTYDEAAEKLGGGKIGSGKKGTITANTIKRFIKQGRLKETKLSENVRRININDLTDFMTKSVQGGENLEDDEEDLPDGIEDVKGQDEVNAYKIAKQLAEAELEKVKAETKVKLAKREWDTIEQALKEIEKTKEELKQEREKLEADKQGYYEKVEQCTQKINQANSRLIVIQEMEKKAKSQLEQSVIIDKNAEDKIKHADELIATLQDCSTYYNENIIPVIQVMIKIRNAIYAEAQNWQGNKNLWGLQQYIMGSMEKVDEFIDKVSEVPIPEELKVPEKVVEKQDVSESIPAQEAG